MEQKKKIELLQDRQAEREQYLKLSDKMRELWEEKDRDYKAIASLQEKIKDLHNKLYSYTYMRKPETT